MPDPAPFDPIAEAHRQWSIRWSAHADHMAAVTSVMRVQQLLLARIEAILQPYDLTFAAYEALRLLAFTRSGSMPMGKMGVRLMVHPASVTNAIRRLEQRALVERHISAADRRIVLATITDSGRAVARDATTALNQANFGIGALSRDETAQLTAMLRQVRVAVGDIADPADRHSATPARSSLSIWAERSVVPAPRTGVGEAGVSDRGGGYIHTVPSVRRAGPLVMRFPKNVVLVAAACLCAVAVMLAGSVGASASADPGSRAAAGSQAGSVARAGSAGSAGSGGWQAENSDTRHRLYGVACLSALRCEAVGAAGTIVATANGGRTWRQQANPLRGSATTLDAIACVAPSSCYVIARPDTILVTHNGGATWSRRVLPVGVSGTDLTDQACLPPYAPIAGRPALCRLGLLDIACISASICYAVATAPPAYDNGTPVPKTPHAAPSSIWLTRDGGAKWTRQSIPPGVPCNGDCQPGLYGYPLEWVTCLSSGLCRAGGGALVNCGHCGFAYAVLVTRGPGQPWKCAQSACAAGGPDAADCPTSTRCYGVQSNNPFGGPNGGVNLLRSTDGGAGWDQIGPQQGWPSVLNAIACPAALTCYLAGSGGSIARITNGTTVTAQHTPTHSNLYGIGCACPAACYAVGDNGTILALR